MKATTAAPAAGGAEATMGARDSIDILVEHRQAQQDAQREERQAKAADGGLDDVNGPLRGCDLPGGPGEALVPPPKALPQ